MPGPNESNRNGPRKTPIQRIHEQGNLDVLAHGSGDIVPARFPATRARRPALRPFGPHASRVDAQLFSYQSDEVSQATDEASPERHVDTQSNEIELSVGDS